MANRTPIVISAGQLQQLQSADALSGIASIEGGLVINELGADVDFRIEGDTTPFLFFVDSGSNAVQIGGGAAGSVASYSNLGTVLNEFGSDIDFRVEGDTLDHMLFLDASGATENIALLAAASPNWQTMDRGIFIGDATTAPTGNPTSGVFMWSESGELKARDGSGNVVTITGSSSGGVDVQDEGVAVATATTLNFTGGGVTATDSGGGVVEVAISGATLADGDYGDVTVSGSGTVITIDSANLQDIIALADPDADRILFWDDSAGEITYLTVGTGLSISDTTITATATGTIGGSTGATDNAVLRADGTGGSTVQNSLVAISDTAQVTGINEINSTGDIVFNEPGNDTDLRVEGDTVQQLFVVDAGLDAVQMGIGIFAGNLADFRQTRIVFNENGGDIDFRVEGDTATNLLLCDASIDAVQFGTTAAGVIADFRSTGTVFNENQGDLDFRVEGDSITHALFVDATSTTENVALVAAAAPNWQSMDRGLFLGNAETAPTGNPASGLFLYSSSGELVVRSSAGTTRTLSLAPHYCELTGDDTTGQTLTHNTVATADFTISESDAFGMGSLANDTITIQRDGLYLISFGCGVSNTSPSGTVQRLFVRLDLDEGSGFNDLRAFAAFPGTSTTVVYAFSTAVVLLSAGDVLQLSLQVQTSDSSNRTVGTALVQRSRLSVTELR